MASTGAQQTIRPFTAGRHNQASVRPRIAQRRLRLDPRSRSERRQALVWQAVLSLLAGAILMVAAATALFYRGDRIAPGVEVAGVAVGGRSTGEAARLLRAEWQQRVVTLEANGATWTVPIETLGILLDAEATVERAYGKGRSLASLQDLLLFGGDRQVEPVWRFDPGVAEASLAELRAQVEVAPTNAGLRVVDGRVEVLPAVAGQSLDVAATVAWMEQNAGAVLEQGRVQVAVAPVEADVTDVSGVVAQAEQLLAYSLAIEAYDPIRDETVMLPVAREEWAGWLSLGVDSADPTRLSWSLESQKIEGFLAGQGAALGPDRYLDVAQALPVVQDAAMAQQPAVQLRVYHHARQHVVQPGETISSIAWDYGMPYPWIQQANPQVGETLAVGQVLTIPSPDALLPLPVVENKRIVVSIGEQRMWAFEDGALRWDWPVSTGIASSPTSPGVFQIQSHEPEAYAGPWDLWMPYFMGIYRPDPGGDFMNGFHGFPSRGGSQLLWTDDLGHPVTYGCVLLSTENAATLFEWAEDGVVVEIRP